MRAGSTVHAPVLPHPVNSASDVTIFLVPENIPWVPLETNDDQIYEGSTTYVKN